MVMDPAVAQRWTAIPKTHWSSRCSEFWSVNLPRIMAKVAPELVDIFAPLIRQEVGKAVAPLQQAVAELREEVGELRGVRAKEVHDIQVLAGRLKAENVALRLQVDSLTDSTRQVSEGMDREQQRIRAANLVILNFEDPQPSVVGLKDRVKALFPDLQEADLLSAERIGPYKGGPHSRPAPVLVKFAGVATKYAALKSSKDLRAKKVFLDTDLTLAQQENRRARQGQYFALKREGKRPFWRADRIFVMENGRMTESGENQSHQYRSYAGVAQQGPSARPPARSSVPGPGPGPGPGAPGGPAHSPHVPPSGPGPMQG